MWLWIGRLLSALASWRKWFVWIAAVIPFITRIVSWVGRLWTSVRNTLLGRLLRMAGLLSVAGAMAVASANAIFAVVGAILESLPLASFSWPSNSLIHSVFGAVDTTISLVLIFNLMVYWVYISLFILAVRLGKYILSLTAG